DVHVRLVAGGRVGVTAAVAPVHDVLRDDVAARVGDSTQSQRVVGTLIDAIGAVDGDGRGDVVHGEGGASGDTAAVVVTNGHTHPVAAVVGRGEADRGACERECAAVGPGDRPGERQRVKRPRWVVGGGAQRHGAALSAGRDRKVGDGRGDVIHDQSGTSGGTA